MRRKRQEIVSDSPVPSSVGVENTATSLEENVELGEVEKQTPVETAKQPESPSTSFPVFEVDREEATYEEKWKEIARALDRIFFWLFLALLVVSSLAVYSQAGRLSSFAD